MRISDRRYGWIEAAIRFSGQFGISEKAAYRHVFGVSDPSVSRHQLQFSMLFERHCAEPVFRRDGNDKLERGKLLLVDDACLPEHPVFAMPPIERWLEDALQQRFYQHPSIERVLPRAYILRRVIGAIRSETVVRIAYVSRKGQSNRLVSPHTIVNVAGRLHMRCFDHSRNEYRDFVLSRIIALEEPGQDQQYVGKDGDQDWNSYSSVIIQAVEDAVSEGVRLDFGLDQTGKRIVKARSAIVEYLCSDPSDGFRSPVAVRRQG